MKHIDKSVMRYIDKDLAPHVVWAEKWKNPSDTYTCYCIALDDSYNDEYGNQTEFIAHGITELKWACSVIKEGRRGEIF